MNGKSIATWGKRLWLRHTIYSIKPDRKSWGQSLGNWHFENHTCILRNLGSHAYAQGRIHVHKMPWKKTLSFHLWLIDLYLCIVYMPQKNLCKIPKVLTRFLLYLTDLINVPLLWNPFLESGQNGIPVMFQLSPVSGIHIPIGVNCGHGNSGIGPHRVTKSLCVQPICFFPSFLQYHSAFLRGQKDVQQILYICPGGVTSGKN